MPYLEVIKQAIERVMGDSLLKEVSKESTLEDLGCDSLDVVEITMEIEDEFFIEIYDTDLKNLKSVKDFITYIKEHK